MQEIVFQALWLVLAALLPIVPLFIIAWHDLKTRTIINWQLMVFAGSMIPLILYHWINYADIFTNLVVSGLCAVILAVLYNTKKLPSGDVLLLIPIILAFGFMDLIWLAIVALIAHLIISAALRKKLEGAKPFAPAVLIGYLFIIIPIVGLIPDILAAAF